MSRSGTSDRRWVRFDGEYRTAFASDDAEGWAAVELFRTKGGKTELVARVVFWDAMGQYMLELKVTELPLPIVEDLILEAKIAIGVHQR